MRWPGLGMLCVNGAHRSVAATVAALLCNPELQSKIRRVVSHVQMCRPVADFDIHDDRHTPFSEAPVFLGSALPRFLLLTFFNNFEDEA